MGVVRLIEEIEEIGPPKDARDEAATAGPPSLSFEQNRVRLGLC